MTRIVANRFPRRIDRAEMVLRQDEFLGKAAGFVIREVVPLPQPHPDGFTAGEVLEEEHQVAHQFRQTARLVAETQQLDRGFPRLRLSLPQTVRFHLRAPFPVSTG